MIVVQSECIDGKYNVKFITVPVKYFANHVKHALVECFKPNYTGLIQEFYDYITPLIQGETTLIMENGIPATVVPFHQK